MVIASDRCLGYDLCHKVPNGCPCSPVRLRQSKVLLSQDWEMEGEGGRREGGVALPWFGRSPLLLEVIAAQLFGKRSRLRMLMKESERMVD